jgi:hypothetical protein
MATEHCEVPHHCLGGSLPGPVWQGKMARMSLPTPTLRTARLRLRPFNSADADALFALRSSAYVAETDTRQREGLPTSCKPLPLTSANGGLWLRARVPALAVV